MIGKFHLGLTLLMFSALGFAQGVTPLIGDWTTVDSKGCEELYSFKGNGTFLSRSGLEIRSGRFSTEALGPNERAQYKITRGKITSNGKPDCDGTVLKPSGIKDVRFIGFDDTQRQLWVCDSPEATNCFGPLHRK